MEFTLSLLGSSQSHTFRDYDYLQVCALVSSHEFGPWEEAGTTESLIKSDKMLYGTLIMVPDSSLNLKLEVYGQRYEYGHVPKGHELVGILQFSHFPKEESVAYPITNQAHEPLSDALVMFHHVAASRIPRESVSRSFRLSNIYGKEVSLYSCSQKSELWSSYLSQIHDCLEKIVSDRQQYLLERFHAVDHGCSHSGQDSLFQNVADRESTTSCHRGVKALLRDRELALCQMQLERIQKSRLCYTEQSPVLHQLLARGHKSSNKDEITVVSQSVSVHFSPNDDSSFSQHQQVSHESLPYEKLPSVSRICQVFYTNGLRNQESTFRTYIHKLTDLQTKMTLIASSYLSLNDSMRRVRKVLRNVSDLISDIYTHIKVMLEHVSKRSHSVQRFGVLDEIETSLDIIHAIYLPKLFVGKQATTSTLKNSESDVSFEEILDAVECVVQRMILLLDGLAQSANGILESKSLDRTTWQLKANARPWFTRLLVDPCTIRVIALLSTALCEYLIKWGDKDIRTLIEDIWSRLSHTGWLVPFYWKITKTLHTEDEFAVDKVSQILLELGHRLQVTLHPSAQREELQLDVEGAYLILSLPMPSQILSQLDRYGPVGRIRVIPFLVLLESNANDFHITFQQLATGRHSTTNRNGHGDNSSMNGIFLHVVKRYLEETKRVLEAKHAGQIRTVEEALANYQMYLSDMMKNKAALNTGPFKYFDAKSRKKWSPVIFASRLVEAIHDLVHSNSRLSMDQLPCFRVNWDKARDEEIFNCIELDLLDRTLKIQ